MNLQLVSRCNSGENSDQCELHDGCVCIKVIHTIGLTESSCHKPGLQPDNLCNFVFLVFKDKIPSVVLDKRVDFISDGFLPLFLCVGWLIASYLVDIPLNTDHLALGFIDDIGYRVRGPTSEGNTVKLDALLAKAED